MPKVTSSLGPLFESSDDVTQDHMYAQALPDATDTKLAKQATQCEPSETGESSMPSLLANKQPDTRVGILPDETIHHSPSNNVVLDATSSL